MSTDSPHPPELQALFDKAVVMQKARAESNKQNNNANYEELLALQKKPIPAKADQLENSLPKTPPKITYIEAILQQFSDPDLPPLRFDSRGRNFYQYEVIGLFKKALDHIIDRRTKDLLGEASAVPALRKAVTAWLEINQDLSNYVEHIDPLKDPYTERYVFKNGVLGYNKGFVDFKPPSPEWAGKYYIDANFGKKFLAPTPRWREACRKFVVPEGATEEEENQLIDRFDAILAYIIMCPKNPAQRIFYFYGAGNNGKSTVCSLIKKLLGNYCVAVPLENFAGNFTAGEFYDKAVNVTGDLGTDRISSQIASALKKLTGKDEYTADRKHKTSVTFLPHVKPIILANEPPNVPESSIGLRRRIEVVVFPNDCSKIGNEDYLEEAFEAEKDAIVSMWVMNVLRNTKKAISEGKQGEAFGKIVPAWDLIKERSFESADPVAEFLDEKGYVLDLNSWITRDDLYLSYCVYTEKVGRSPLNANNFGKHLRRLKGEEVAPNCRKQTAFGLKRIYRLKKSD